MLTKIAPYLTVCLVAAIGISAMAAPVAAAPQTFYIGLVILPNKAPAGYLSVQNNLVRVAKTAAGLETAKPTKAKSAQLQDTGRARAYQQFYEFPDTDVPVSASGIEKASVKLSIYRTRYIQRTSASSPENMGVYGDVSVSRRDASGNTWTYVCHVNANERSLSSNSAQHPLLLTVTGADPKHLKVDVTTKMEGRKARIGMQAKADGIDIYNVLKNGKNAPVKLEVTGKDGKHVVSETGDPVKFGFT
ncbi:MAG: hypothetical protein ABSD48_09435 [Armatimonadota bacterium]|jgi:hypothetical protein